MNPLPMSSPPQSISLVPLMSLVQSPIAADHFLPQSFQRKRTASFSVASTSLSASPRPTKAPRRSPAMGLRRTESYLSLPIASSTSVTIISVQGSCRPSQYTPSTVPYHQSLQYYKEQRQRCKAAARANANTEPITIRTRLERTYSQPQRQPYQAQRPPSSSNPVSSPATPPSRSRPLTRTTTLLDVTSQVHEPSSLASEPTSTSTPFHIPPSFRASSPLSPKRHLLPGRPVFPRSKAAPDLYRIAIKTCMRYSPEGQKILRMGPRLALSILTATQDLERMVAEQESREGAMEDKSESTEGTWTSEESEGSVLSSSWVDVQNEDWEMLDRTT